MFSDPEKNINQFAIGEDWKVADLGAGSGAYTLSAAERVGSDGHVYAIDINRDLLSKISNEARERRLHAVQIIAGDVEKLGGTQLQDGTIDAAIAANIFFQLDNKKGLVQEIKRILKPSGRVLIVDWAASFGGIGPQGDRIVSLSEMKKLFEGAGFVYESEIDAGSHHYGIIYKKNKEQM